VAAKQLRVRLLSPARTLLDQEAAMVVLPAFDGEWGILPGHAPLVALLGTGCLRVTVSEQVGHAFAVRGGFVQVRDNVVTILTPECAGPAEINGAAVDAEIARLQEQVAVPAERGGQARQLAWARACRTVLGQAPPGPKR